MKLPDFLYYRQRMSQGVSPSALFDPCSAIDGQPWQCSTAPANERQQKTILFTSESTVGVSQVDLFAIAAFLEQEGFNIFPLWLEEELLGECLVERQCREIVEKYGIARDKIVTLDFAMMRELLCAVQSPRKVGVGYTYNQYKFEVCNSTEAHSENHLSSWVPVPSRVIDMRPVIDCINAALVSAKINITIRSLSEFQVSAVADAIHDVFLKNTQYRKLIDCIVLNPDEEINFTKEHWLIALLIPQLRHYFSVEMLYNSSDHSVLIAQLILSDNELRSRLTFLDLKNILESHSELTPYFKEMHYPDFQIREPLLLEIQSVTEKSISVLDLAIKNGLLDVDKIMAVKFAMPIPKSDSALMSLDLEFNSLYDFVITTFENVTTIEVPNLYLGSVSGSLGSLNIAYFARHQEMYNEDLFLEATYQKPPNILYVHNQSLCASQVIHDTGSNHQTYMMVESGEILSVGFFVDYVRTGVVQYEYDDSGLNVKSVSPINITEIPVNSCDEDWIQSLRLIDDNYFYAKFSQNLLRGWTRLLSIHAHECVVGVVNNNQLTSALAIFKGDDGFYQAYTEAAVEITYVVGVEKKYFLNDQYQQLHFDDPIRQIIDEYRQESSGFSLVADENKPIPELGNCISYDNWCDQLYADRAGVCWHRALAVAKRIEKVAPHYANRVRIITINNNHQVIEVLNYGTWVSIDLGGGANTTLVYENETGISANSTINLESTTVSESDRGALFTEKNKLESFLIKTFHPEICESSDKFLRAIENDAYKKMLVRVDSVEEVSNALLKNYARDKNKIFYMDNIKLLSAEKKQVIIDQDRKPIIQNSSSLVFFLQDRPLDVQRRRYLLIDIRESALDAQTLVSINAAFDIKARSICGCAIPDNVCVIAITDVMPSDRSFLSRQDIILNVKADFISNEKPHERKDILRVDLQGAVDWQKKLFGPIVLDDNKMVWLESDFSRQCASSLREKVVLIQHFRKEDEMEIKKFLSKSRAQGHFDYCGYQLFIAENVIFDFEDGYDFSSFKISPVTVNATAFDPSALYFEINTYNYDLLLNDKLILDGLYKNTPGLLAVFANKDLLLFITTPLAEVQWWTLFSVAEKNNTTLILSLADTVVLPGSCVYEVIKRTSAAVEKCDCVYISNDTTSLSSEILILNSDVLVLDVEDYSFQDLFFAVTHQKSESGFSDFTVKESDVLSHLKKSGTIILKGEFPDDLLSMMSTMLFPVNRYLWLNGEKVFIPGKLILIIEDKSLFDDVNSSCLNGLNWLGSISVKYYPESVKRAPMVVQEPDHRHSASLEKDDALAFIENRKAQLLSLFVDAAIVQLISKTGCGKSRLMKILDNETPSNFLIYREIIQFEKWANDKSSNIKILFIDESNLDNQHYTIFSPLKTGGSRKILYRGKLILLDENHKVVFARNPLDYGGGRIEQKLFEDNSIPEFHFSDFPPAYIYYELLKPIFDSAHLALPEDHFKNDCVVFIDAYLNKNNMTVRQLQQFILSYCLSQKKSENQFEANFYFRLFSKKSDTTSQFVLTESSASIRSQIAVFIQIKKLQRAGKLHSGIGLNGIFILGEPGVGKSELVEFTLRKYCCEFIKIDGSVALADKETLLLNAFHSGTGIWADEMNCYSDGRWAKIINKLLTGEDFETGEAARKPGFFLIATGNHAYNQGRCIIDPALSNRCLMLELQKPTKEDIKQILLGESGDIDSDALVDDFLALQQTSSDPTLRCLLRALPDVSAHYRNDFLKTCR
ncbi:MAG: hypothetical protein NTZ67_03750 [Gammaproteobacteria bacterium]|nr:hypothetical protein [Gammaproteobacteria bacterium]